MSNSAFSAGGGGAGTVSSVTVASGNAVALAVTNPTVTTAGTITLTPHGNFISQQVFLAGAGTYNKPANVTSIKVRLRGGGGGGGTTVTTITTLAASGGGGEGAYSEKYYAAAAATYVYAVGAGGASATNGANTTFDTVTAGHGIAGDSTVGGAAGDADGGGGAGGIATCGDLNIAGAPGEYGIAIAGVGGQGGSGGGSGGIAGFNSNGGDAQANSGGGGGGMENNAAAAAYAGGAGGSGWIVVEEYA